MNAVLEKLERRLGGGGRCEVPHGSWRRGRANSKAYDPIRLRRELQSCSSFGSLPSSLMDFLNRNPLNTGFMAVGRQRECSECGFGFEAVMLAKSYPLSMVPRKKAVNLRERERNCLYEWWNKEKTASLLPPLFIPDLYI